MGFLVIIKYRYLDEQELNELVPKRVWLIVKGARFHEVLVAMGVFFLQGCKMRP